MQILVLWRQNVTASERTGDKRSRHKKIRASKRRHKKDEDPHQKIQSPTQQNFCSKVFL